MDNILYNDNTARISDWQREQINSTPLPDALAYINKLCGGALKVVGTLIRRADGLAVQDIHIILSDHTGWPCLRLGYVNKKAKKAKDRSEVYTRIILAKCWDAKMEVPTTQNLGECVHSMNLAGFRKAVSKDNIECLFGKSLEDYFKTDVMMNRVHLHSVRRNLEAVVAGIRRRSYSKVDAYDTRSNIIPKDVILMLRLLGGEIKMDELAPNEQQSIQTVISQALTKYKQSDETFKDDMKSMLYGMDGTKWFACISMYGIYAMKIKTESFYKAAIQAPSESYNTPVEMTLSDRSNILTDIRLYDTAADLPKELYTRLAMLRLYVSNEVSGSFTNYGYLEHDTNKFFIGGDYNIPDYGAATEQDGYNDFQNRWVLL